MAIVNDYAYAANVNTGVAAGNFMKLGAGVRAQSIGGAFIAIADDPYAVYWNPAGLSQLRSLELSSAYSTWISGTSYSNFAAAFPFAKSTVGILYNLVSIGSMQETTVKQPAGTGRIFNPSESSLAVAFSQRILPGLSVGMALKTLSQNIDSANANGFGADFGAMWRWEDYILGFSARNIVGSLGNKALTNNYGLGLAYKFNPYAFAIDANLPNDNVIQISAGVGFNYQNSLLSRIGFNSRSEQNAGGNFTIGLGYNFKNMKIDYAFIPYGDLGQTHKFSFSIYPFGIFNPKIVKIIVSPKKTKIALGEKMMFRAEGLNIRDDYIDLRPVWEVKGGIGEIDSDGYFKASKLGKGKVFISLWVQKDKKVEIDKGKKKIEIKTKPSKPEPTMIKLIDSADVEVVPQPPAQ